jgi:Mg2+/Co2+ transporter CorC
MTTVAGVAFRHLDRLPRVGDRVNVEDCTLEVLQLDGLRIAQVRVCRGPITEEPKPASPPEAEPTPPQTAEDQQQANTPE